MLPIYLLIGLAGLLFLVVLLELVRNENGRRFYHRLRIFRKEPKPPAPMGEAHWGNYNWRKDAE